MPSLVAAQNGQAENGIAKGVTNGVVKPSSPPSSPFLNGVTHKGLRNVLATVESRDPHQPEFLSAVKEVALALEPVFEKRPEMLQAFAILTEPERQIVFRVPWLDDAGVLRVNRGYRVQASSAIGPYKGGLRFHPSVNLSILKFLAWEQTFKNALTTLPMGAGKGGSDFDPKGKSDAELQRFCQSFMTELYRHIGSHTDVPAGDIGVGAKEIGYLYGQYKRLTGLNTGTLTGKGMEWGGSQIRPEATGFGAVIFAKAVVEDEGGSLAGKRCIVTGSGNVAQYCALKLLEEGAVVLALSDSQGYIFEPQGLTMAQLEQVMAIKSSHNGRLSQYQSSTGRYVAGRKPWELDVPVDMAFPCATQHELNRSDAETLVKHGCKYVFEGANMPSTDRAVAYFHEKGVIFGNGKAANAGGVAVSGLEMSQNRMGLTWTREEVNAKLTDIMLTIFRSSKKAAQEYNTNLAAGANIAAFLKVGEAVLAQGAV